MLLQNINAPSKGVLHPGLQNIFTDKSSTYRYRANVKVNATAYFSNTNL